LLQKYLELEHQRFGQHFDFSIEIHEELNLENLFIPGFLIQPHLENAIWHGLRYGKEKGSLLLRFEPSASVIVVKIEDDGIGLEESKKLKTENQKSHKSRGFSNIQERIELLNGVYRMKIKMEMESPIFREKGTRVVYHIPISHKQ
jgi:sensor histidine kinase YesM